jgi:hypothetical protein
VRYAGFVAPRAGAWIETFLPAFFLFSLSVAPRAGAWIGIGYQRGPGAYTYALPEGDCGVAYRRQQPKNRLKKLVNEKSHKKAT